MATTWQTRDEDGDPVTFRFFSLAEYVREGGVFSDAANSGKCMHEEARDGHFVAAVTVDDVSWLGDDHLINLAGAEPAGFWLDSVTSFYLLRAWPANVPPAARFADPADPFDLPLPECPCGTPAIADY